MKEEPENRQILAASSKMTVFIVGSVALLNSH